MTEKHPYQITPFKIEGPEPPRTFTATEEAERIESEADRSTDPVEKARLKHRAARVRALSDLTDKDCDLQAESDFEEAEDRLKALGLLREHSSSASSGEINAVVNLIERLAGSIREGSETDAERATTALYKIASKATSQLQIIADECPDKIKPVLRKNNYFPILSDGKHTETKIAIKKRNALLKRLELRKEAKPTSGRRSDMRDVFDNMLGWIEREAIKFSAHETFIDKDGDHIKVKELVDDYGDLEVLDIHLLLWKCDPKEPDSSLWLNIALEALYWSYGNGAKRIPSISGVNQNHEEIEADKKRKSLSNKWKKKFSMLCAEKTDRADNIPEELFGAPTKEKHERYDYIFNELLENEDNKIYVRDAVKYETYGSIEWKNKKQFTEFREKFRERWCVFWP